MRKKRIQDRTRLIQAAMGNLACDLTVRNIQYFNVFTGEIYPAEVDVLDGIVVRVREEGQPSLIPSKDFYDGQGQYLIPGYIDTHMHVESTMMIPENLSRAILPWGTTTICTDPHEIGNVCGIEGVKFMLENAKKSALRQYVLAPSCVPSVPKLENTGTSFGAKEVGELLDMDDVIGIAEIMDFVGVYLDDERMHTIIDEGIKRGMYLQGHAPGVTGKELTAYRLGGPFSDHESQTAAEVQEKLRNGIHVNLRASSLIDSLSFLVDGCKDHPWRDFVSVCTDDVHAKDLLTVGHINKVVKKIVDAGIDSREAIKMATLNAAREYHFDDLGAVAPGYLADMQIVASLDGCRPSAVFVEGKLIAENGVYLGEDVLDDTLSFPNTMQISQIHSEADFALRVPEGYTGDTIRVNIMEPSTPAVKIFRKTTELTLPVKEGCVDISSHPELAFMAVVNRFDKDNISIALIKDFGLQKGALATTISHDSHNLTLVYRDLKSAYEAAMALQKSGGGTCAVSEGKATVLPLPVAGLMANQPCETIAEQIDAVQAVVNEISGGSMGIMDCSVMALPVIPGTVITDMGLIDGLSQTFIPIFPES